MLCGCPDSGCQCVVTGGPGITITGTGDDLDPYTVSLDSDPAALIPADTSTVDMHTATTAGGTELSADVRLDPDGGLSSTAAGLGVDVDGTGPNALTTGPNGLRVVPGAVDLDPDGGLISGPDGLGVRLDPAAPNAASITGAGLRVVPDLSAITTRIDMLTHISRAQRILYNQGSPKVNLTQVSWVNLIAIPPMEQQQRASYYNVSMPPVGTTITGMHGAPNTTVVASGSDRYIPLGDWQALWYLLPTDQATGTSVAANLRRTSYGVNAPRMPDNAILIAWRSGMEDKEVHWGDGSISVPWRVAGDVLRQQQQAPPAIGQAINLGSSGFQRVSYRRINHVWQVKGYYSWGGTGIAAPGGGYLYQAIDFAAPVVDYTRTQWLGVGTGQFYTPVGGGFAFTVTPTMDAGATRIMFNASRSTTFTDTRWMRVWDGSGGADTAFPNVGSPGYVSGAWLSFALDVPAGALPQT